MRTSLDIFAPGTIPLNIGLDMLTSDFFMSCLDSLLEYSTGEFQASQLIAQADMSQMVLYFLHSTLVLSFYID